MPFIVWGLVGIAGLFGAGFLFKEADESANNLLALGVLAVAIIILVKSK